MEFEILEKRNFTKKEKERIRLYIEAGLAVFLAAALAFAGGADAFTERGGTKGNPAGELVEKEEAPEEPAADDKTARQEEDCISGRRPGTVPYHGGKRYHGAGDGRLFQ